MTSAPYMHNICAVALLMAPPPHIPTDAFFLTRAPLGYFYNAPHWGIFIMRPTGGGAISSPPPPLISETTRPILKIQAAFESLEKLSKENKFY